MICLVLPSFTMAAEVALSPEVLKYNQDEFHSPVVGTSTYGINDCVPTSVGMVFGYFYKKYRYSGNYDLIPNPNNLSSDLSDWSTNNAGIKELINYRACELDDPQTCTSGNYSLSDWTDYNYGQLGGTPGTSSSDLCHKIRQAFTDYDSSFNLTVSYDQINTNMGNKDEIVSRIKSEIDSGNPVMLNGVAGMDFWFINSTTPTPNTAPTSTPEELSGGHAMVITAYNNDIFRLNFGYDNTGEEPEIIINAEDTFGFTSFQGLCAEVYFFTMGENDEVGLNSNDEWVSSGDAASINFVNAYVKFDGENTIGDVTSSVYQKSGTDMYVQEFEDASFNETYIICELRDNWYYVYPVTGYKLAYWLSNYSTIGHPEGMPFDAYDEDGAPINVQKFVIGSGLSAVTTYIGTENGSSTVSGYSEVYDLTTIKNLFTTAVSDTKIELVWSASEVDGVSYQIYHEETGASGDPSLLTTVTTPYYLHESLTASTSYDYTVKVVKDDLESGTVEATVSTLSTGTTFAPTPVGVYPTFGDVEFAYGYYTPYGYGVANASITSEAPCPTCPDIWELNVIDYGAAVACAVTPKGFPFNTIMVEFRAKVENGANPLSTGGLMACDYSGNPYTQWDHKAPLTPLFDPQDYEDGEFFTYRVALADLVDSSYQPNAEGFFKQFAIALTTGSLGNGEKWYFDWIHIYTSGVDFVDNYALWYDCDDIYSTTYSNGNRVITPSEAHPSVVSPGLYPYNEVYTKVGIKFSVANASEELFRVFFNTGSGFTNAPFVTGIVDHTSGTEQTVILDIPTAAIGNIKGLAVVFFDNSTYQNKTISVNTMAVLVDDDDESSVDFAVQTVSDFIGE